MKGKRLKDSQKRMLFYKLHFGIEPPYRVLVDGTVCNAALQSKINLAEQIPKYLQAEVKLCTTSCAIAELESFGVTMSASLKILKQFLIVECHHQNAIPVFHCFKSKYQNNSVKGKNKYCLATQDTQLREAARKFGPVPLLYLNSKVLILEPPSTKARQLAKAHEEQVKATPVFRKDVLLAMKSEAGLTAEQSESKKKKRKRPKGPNPLSCMKKKAKVHNPVTSVTSVPSKARRRRKSKKPAGVARTLEHLSAS